MITKQARWFLNLPYPEQAKMYEKFAKMNPNLFNSLVNHEYIQDPDIELNNITHC